MRDRPALYVPTASRYSGSIAMCRKRLQCLGLFVLVLVLSALGGTPGAAQDDRALLEAGVRALHDHLVAIRLHVTEIEAQSRRSPLPHCCRTHIRTLDGEREALIRTATELQRLFDAAGEERGAAVMQQMLVNTETFGRAVQMAGQAGPREAVLRDLTAALVTLEQNAAEAQGCCEGNSTRSATPQK